MDYCGDYSGGSKVESSQIPMASDRNTPLLPPTGTNVEEQRIESYYIAGRVRQVRRRGFKDGMIVFRSRHSAMVRAGGSSAMPIQSDSMPETKTTNLSLPKGESGGLTLSSSLNRRGRCDMQQNEDAVLCP